MRDGKQQCLQGHGADTTHNFSYGAGAIPVPNAKNQGSLHRIARAAPSEPAENLRRRRQRVPCPTPPELRGRPGYRRGSRRPLAGTVAPHAGPAHAHGPALVGSARTLPAHAQGASSACTPLRADGSCLATAFPLPAPGRMVPAQAHHLQPFPTVTSLPCAKILGPQIWRLTKQLERRPPPDRCARRPPRTAFPPAQPRPRLPFSPAPSAVAMSSPSCPSPYRSPVSLRRNSARQNPPAPGPAAHPRRPTPPARLHLHCGSRRSAADRPPVSPLRPTLRPV